MDDNSAMLTKGMKVEARWFQADDPPGSLSGNQMKLTVTEKLVVGTVTHIRGDHPTTPTRVEVHVKPDDGGEEIRVKPEHIVRVIQKPTTVYESPVRKERESRVTDTRSLYMENPELGLLGMFEDQRPGRKPMQFIADMESQGQRELVNQTTQLPKQGSDDPAWEKMGVMFGDVVPNDPIFRKVELPAGWKLRPTDHAMWNDLLDDQGRVRGKMFYKAAFYDRSANIRAETRYGMDREYKVKDDYDSPRREVAKDFATGKVLFASDFLEQPTRYTEESAAAEDAARKKVLDWLDTNRPDWKNAAAYWGWD